jgi:hypothetical protein
MKRALVLVVVVVLLCAGQVFAEPDTSELILNAKTFAEIGDWENGLKLLEQYILQHPKDAEARLLLAESYFNWPDKQTQGERVVDLNKERGRAQMRILGKLGEEGFAMLLKGLSSETPDVLYECRDVLEEKRDRRAIDALIRLARERPERTDLSIYVLSMIEEGREKVDKRVVDFLIARLEDQGSEVELKYAAARALALLSVREAVPAAKKELHRIAGGEVGTRDEEQDLAREAIFIVDLMARTSPSGFAEEVDKVLNRFGVGVFFDVAREQARELSKGGLVHLAGAALDLIKADPGIAWTARKPRSNVDRFLMQVADVFPGVLLEEGNKKRLHALLGSPLPKEVREGLASIAAEIGDKEALPVLFAKLNPYSADPKRVYVQWEKDGSREVWQAAEAISGEKALAFLLEKLKSDDMAWVAMAASLLKDRGDRKAAETLKERYLELKPLADRWGEAAGYWEQYQMHMQTGLSQEQVIQIMGPAPGFAVNPEVLEVIRSAYEALTGQDIDGSGEGRASPPGAAPTPKPALRSR